MPNIVKGLVVVGSILAIFLASMLFSKALTLSDYQRSLNSLANKIDASPINTEERAFHMFRHAQLTGNLQDYKQTDNLLEQLPTTLEKLYLQSKIALHTHNTQKAELLISELHQYADPRANILDIQLDIQKKQLQQAQEKVTAFETFSSNWEMLSLAAIIEYQFEHSDISEDLYNQAQELLSVKQTHTYAWLELQKGIIDLEDKKLIDALEHFNISNRLYSGHWLTEEHLAETYALLGKTDKALKLYESVIENSPAPQYLIALAELIKQEQPERYTTLTTQAKNTLETHMQLYPLAVAGHGPTLQ